MTTTTSNLCLAPLGALALAALVTSAALGLGCGLTTVTVPAESVITVPGQGVLGGNPLVANDVFPSDALSEALAQSIEQSFNTEGYQKDAVNSLKLTKLKLIVLDPEENGRQLRGLGFLEKLTVSVGADGADTVVAAESEAAAFDGSPGPVVYDMPTTGVELQPIFAAGNSLDMTADVEPSDPPQFETDVRFETELTIDINVFGIF